MRGKAIELIETPVLLISSCHHSATSICL